MSHTCSAAFVRCMDFRLTPAVEDFFRTHELSEDADVISLAGAAKGLADGKGSFLESQIDLSKRLHEIKKVILVNHTDCGAYGGHAAFASSEEEQVKHVSDLHTAKEQIQSSHPELEVELWLAYIEENGNV